MRSPVFQVEHVEDAHLNLRVEPKEGDHAGLGGGGGGGMHELRSVRRCNVGLNACEMQAFCGGPIGRTCLLGIALFRSLRTATSLRPLLLIANVEGLS